MARPAEKDASGAKWKMEKSLGLSRAWTYWLFFLSLAFSADSKAALVTYPRSPVRNSMILARTCSRRTRAHTHTSLSKINEFSLRGQWVCYGSAAPKFFGCTLPGGCSQLAPAWVSKSCRAPASICRKAHGACIDLHEIGSLCQVARSESGLGRPVPAGLGCSGSLIGKESTGGSDSEIPRQCR